MQIRPRLGETTRFGEVPRGARRAAWDERGYGVTSGEKSVTIGIFWRTLPLFAAAIVALSIINVFTGISDSPDHAPIYFVVYEVSSAITSISFLWICWIAYWFAPIDRSPIWRVAAVHTLGLLVFGFFHIGGFLVLRVLIFQRLGLPYEANFAGRFIYELRKDGFGYVLGVAAMWAITRIYGQKAAPPVLLPATFDIRDGGRLTRVAVADIVALASAGNYVEFILADGRRLLMRSPLAAMEKDLTPQGFVRTHRSWLINGSRVTELRPEKSGDYAVRLGDVEAPLSRRYPEALARLRSR